MADIQTATTSKKNHIGKRKKLSTRIDLTPMVDLGFLLITFFIFTTTLTQASVMKLNLPQDGHPSTASEKKTLTLILGKQTIGVYSGNDTNKIHFTNYSAEGIRFTIQAMQEKIAQTTGEKSQLYVIIKPTNQSIYKNMVDVLDEMLINNVSRYIVTDATDTEENLLQ